MVLGSSQTVLIQGEIVLWMHLRNTIVVKVLDPHGTTHEIWIQQKLAPKSFEVMKAAKIGWSIPAVRLAPEQYKDRTIFRPLS